MTRRRKPLINWYAFRRFWRHALIEFLLAVLVMLIITGWMG